MLDSLRHLSFMPRQNPTPTPTFYRPELDGLRFLAFLFVFTTHAFPDDATVYMSRGVSWPLAHVLSHLVHIGRFGVPLFFVLSSYLITELLIREHRKTGAIDVARFYLRRALRIWPLYIVFVLAAAAWLRSTRGPAAFPLRYFLSLLLFWGNWGMIRGWGPGAGDKLTGPLWSVSVEEQFYLVWPVLLLIVGVRRIRALAVVLVALAFAGRLAMDMTAALDTIVWYSSFTWLDAIGAGALLAVALRGGEPRLTPAMRLLLLAAGPALWLAAAILFKALPLYSVFYPLILAGSISMFLSAAGNRAFAHPVLVFLGRRSYGLYVLHLAGLALASFLFPPLTLPAAGAGLALTVLMAAAAYAWLEAPFLALKRRLAYVESQPA